MKTLSILFSFLAVVSVSCENGYFANKVGASLDGTWKLETLRYVDSLGNPHEISNSSSLLILSEDKVGNSDNNERFGRAVYDDGFVASFLYDAGSGDAINILFDDPDLPLKKLPLDGIGRNQVYEMDISKNELRFWTDAEYDGRTKQVLRNVEYRFRRQ